MEFIRRKPRLLYLAWMGMGFIALWGLLAFRYPLAPSLANARAGWMDLVAPTWINVGLHLAIYLALTILYVLALRLLGNPRLEPPLQGVPPKRLYALIMGVWLLSSLLLLTMAPAGESHDIFDYVFRGRMMVELDGNPLAETPKAYSRAPYYRYVAWHSHVDTYGPLWEMSSATVAISVRVLLQALGMWGENVASCPETPRSCQMLMGYLTGYRLLAIGLTGLSAGLIASMVRHNQPDSTQPYLVAAALVAWLWSPVLLVASAVGAHNDAIMIALLLAAFWLMQRQRWLLALLMFVLAAHVKLTILVLTPVLGLWLVRRCGWWRAIGYGVAALAIGLGASWLLYWPFDGWGTLPRMLAERAIFRANSLWHVIYYALYVEYRWPSATVWYLTVQLPTWLFAVSALVYCFWFFDFRPRRWKRTPTPNWADDRLLWRAATVVSLLYLLVGSFWFQHWYVVWALAPAALLPGSLLTHALLPWLGFGALASNVVANFGVMMTPKDASRRAIYALTVTVIWLPALVGGLWQSVSHKARNRTL